MDFITGLSSSKTKDGQVVDAVLVVVDRFTKIAHYLPCVKSINAVELAELIDHEIVKRYGVPTSFITDRGLVFTSEY